MKVLRQFEQSERRASRQASQIRSMIEDLKRGVLLLDTDIGAVEAFERQLDPTNAAYPIAARTMKARRNNLILTISFLEERLNALANIEVELKTPPTLFGSEFSDVTN
jgi:nicotinamide riboside kinase